MVKLLNLILIFHKYSIPVCVNILITKKHFDISLKVGDPVWFYNPSSNIFQIILNYNEIG